MLLKLFIFLIGFLASFCLMLVIPAVSIGMLSDNYAGMSCESSEVQQTFDLVCEDFHLLESVSPETEGFVYLKILDHDEEFLLDPGISIRTGNIYLVQTKEEIFETGYNQLLEGTTHSTLGFYCHNPKQDSSDLELYASASRVLPILPPWAPNFNSSDETRLVRKTVHDAANLISEISAEIYTDKLDLDEFSEKIHSTFTERASSLEGDELLLEYYKSGGRVYSEYPADIRARLQPIEDDSLYACYGAGYYYNEGFLHFDYLNFKHPLVSVPAAFKYMCELECEHLQLLIKNYGY